MLHKRGTTTWHPSSFLELTGHGQAFVLDAHYDIARNHLSGDGNRQESRAFAPVDSEPRCSFWVISPDRTTAGQLQTENFLADVQEL